MKNIRLLPWLTLLLAGCQTQIAETPRIMALVFDKPAGLWEERLPLGNGRLGAMPDGGIAAENIILNEISLWSGSPANDLRPGAHRVVPVIRELLYKEQVPRAQEIMYRFFTSRTRGSEGSNGALNTFGSYQVLGSLSLDFTYDRPGSSVSDYTRMLDISTATSFTSFNLEGITYTRECFTSLADDVIVLHLAASQPGTLHFKATLKRPERASVRTEDSCLIMEGSLFSGQDTVPGMRYYTRMDIIPEGPGRLSFKDDSIILQNATQASIVISASTDFRVDSMCLSRDSSYIFRADSLARRAALKAYPALKKDHIDAYQHFYHRVTLQLPDSSDLYFQLGRYLLIAATRPGSLPPNLQGLWTPDIQTPWDGAYDLNMHLQMNFWPALSTNLAEFHQPLADFTAWLSEKGKHTAAEYYNAPGWTVHARTNPWGYTAPGHNAAWSAYNTGGGWLCGPLWDYYLYTLDIDHLKTIYPVLKEAARFYLTSLMEDPVYGWMVPVPSMSYGNTYYIREDDATGLLSVPLFLCMGSTADVQMVKELFSNVIAANRILMNTEDFPFIYKLQEALDRLPPYTVGETGCLQRWLYDYTEEDLRMRNVTHLYALYPGSQITGKDPALLKACANTLERRGYGGSGWQMAWNLNLRARLEDGEGARKVLNEMMSPAMEESVSPYLTGDISSITLLGSGIYPNGFSSNPPFQIDGNLGGCAGIAEMLLQSHQGYIHVLPALPGEWTQKGSYRGLCARGGAEVSCKWENGEILEIRIRAKTDNTFILKVPENFHRIKKKYIQIPLKKGEEITYHTKSKINRKFAL
ncbi:MAG: glycoside hydrolase family 95 protein [Bacteroidales bacterium]|jgi:alpha-L-fucosidase 2